MIDRKDIDAVLIATPDHWHAKLAIEAMGTGKHVYLEKPMTLWSRLDQAIEVRNTVRRLNRVLQVGPQATADPGVRQAHEAIQAGRIGKVTWAQGGYNRNSRVSDFDWERPLWWVSGWVCRPIVRRRPCFGIPRRKQK